MYQEHDRSDVKLMKDNFVLIHGAEKKKKA